MIGICQILLGLVMLELICQFKIYDEQIDIVFVVMHYGIIDDLAYISTEQIQLNDDEFERQYEYEVQIYSHEMRQYNIMAMFGINLFDHDELLLDNNLQHYEQQLRFE